jgi:hypothetical protein
MGPLSARFSSRRYPGASNRFAVSRLIRGGGKAHASGNVLNLT